MEDHVNYLAYNSVENLANFSDKEFVQYCQEKLKSCDKHIDFIKKHCMHSLWKGNICEIGSGNSKLLYKLEKEQLLREGIGYEISKSRFLFAERFKSFLNCTKVNNMNENVLKSPIRYKHYDMIIAVDLVLQLICPTEDSAETEIFSWIYDSLNENGYLLAELCDFQHFLRMIEISANNQCQLWHEFPDSDPWRYGLYKISRTNLGDIEWRKMFLKRTSLETSSFTNVLRQFTPEMFCKTLQKAGFNEIKIFNSWDNSNSIEMEQGEYIVLAKK